MSNGGLQVGTTSTAGSIGANSAVNIGTGGALTLVKNNSTTFGNNVTNGLGGTGTLNVDSMSALALTGTLSDGAGVLALTQSGSGTTTVTGNNTYSGATTLTAGTLQVGNGTSGSLNGASAVTVSGSGTFTLDLATSSFANNLNLNSATATLKIIQPGALTLSGVLSGTGIFNQNSAATVIVNNGADTYSGAVHINAGILQIGDGTGGSLGGTTSISVASGAALATDLANGATLARSVILSASATTLKATQSGTNTLSGVISGTGVFDQNGAGTTILSGKETYTGVTNVNAGALIVTGSLAAGAVTVTGGANLGGTGTLAGNVNVLSAGQLNPGGVATPGTLTVGSLVLNAGASTTFRLGGAGGANDSVGVTKNLTLGGALDITPLAGFQVGSYTLMTYGGTLTGGFSSVNGLSGFTTSISTGVAHSINLVVSSGSAQYWDGTGAANNKTISGGGGTWNLGASNWTDAAGATNSVWGNGTAVFSTPGGMVSLGAPISAQGLIFGSTGYTVSGTSANTLNLTGVMPTISVTKANTSATISAQITGTAGLNADGAGTLILTNAANSYTGGTMISNGQLQIGTSSVAGSPSAGAMEIGSGGTLSVLKVTGNSLANDISNGLAGIGTLNIASATATLVFGTLTDGLSGQMALKQNGAGTTTVSGTDTYTGVTKVTAGTLQVGNGTSGSLSGASAVTVSGKRHTCPGPRRWAFR